MGSGSTGKAAVLEGYRFLGMDSDTEHGYFEIAKARIYAARNEPDLFTTAAATGEPLRQRTLSD
jgi:DNA modification methylase